MVQRKEANKSSSDKVDLYEMIAKVHESIEGK